MKLQNTLKNIVKIGLVAKLVMVPLVVGLNGCREDSNDFYKKGKYNDYEVRAGFDGSGRIVIIDSDIDAYITGKAGINAREAIENLKDKKRFSEINIDEEIPLDYQIIKYANLDSLEKIYEYVCKNGEDCK